MRKAHSAFKCSLLAATAVAAASFQTAHADSMDDKVVAIEKQIQALKGELHHVRSELARRDKDIVAAHQEAKQAQETAIRSEAAARQATHALDMQPAGNLGSIVGITRSSPAYDSATSAQLADGGKTQGALRLGPVTITVGGFIEAASVFRTTSEGADIASSWNGIPFRNNVAGNLSEFRETARQSRVSLLAQSDVGKYTHLAAYLESDFLGAAPTANSTESNSYNPRLRHGYLTIDRSDMGLHLLAGQTWSLLTQSTSEITPRKELTPFTIDAQYVPGFVWTRQPQIRLWKTLDNHRVNIAMGLENPQTSMYVGPNQVTTAGQSATDTALGGATVTYAQAGGSGYAGTNNYSLDPAPDITAKVAFDPGYGHYELFGVARFLRTHVTYNGSGTSQVVPAGGGGASFVIPMFNKKVTLQGNFLAGVGIGRYGSSQLPDATLGRNGDPVPLPEVMAMVGVVGHPRPSLDLYAYVGTEQEGSRSYSANGKGYGYGSPLYSNVGCSIEGAAAGTCVGNTSGIVQGTTGFWWRALKGPYGTVQTGLQYSYTERTAFKGLGGSPVAHAHIAMFSIRYYPFQ
ncbi:hypothetical protein [Granulibacter bethesdensis]|nr:hypothetical protein [Granulibacter bethesdensis]